MTGKHSKLKGMDFVMVGIVGSKEAYKRTRVNHVDTMTFRAGGITFRRSDGIRQGDTNGARTRRGALIALPDDVTHDLGMDGPQWMRPEW